MKKSLVTLALLACVSSMAFATNSNGCGPSSNTPKKCDETPVVNPVNSSSTAVGVGIGIGVAGASSDSKASVGNVSSSSTGGAGGSVRDSGNSTNLNVNTANGGTVKDSGNSSSTSKVDNKNTNQQGQLQGQLQGQSQSVTGSGNSKNIVDVKGSTQSQSTSSISNSGGNTQSVGSTTSGNAQTTNVSTVDPHSLEIAKIQADAARDVADTKITIRNTPSVSGPSLTSANDTCMGSSSGSFNAPGIGVSVGSTWVDNNCRMLKNSRELWNMGMRAAAMALMCNDADNKKALESTGFTCPGTEGPALLSNKPSDQYTDPIVRHRLGLAPLK